jgi:ubiquinone/menaquinone biosynthesis C-methylase UbiE
MTNTGDTERQAFLRDKAIKQSNEKKQGLYTTAILSVLNPGMTLLDIGCGTGHIVQELATSCAGVLCIGLDISSAMIEIARRNNSSLPNVLLNIGDGLRLPFSACSFDIVINRLAEYSVHEAYRVLRKGGYFIEYGLGPDADREIKEFFQDRIETDCFCIPRVKGKWKDEVCEEVVDVGFAIESIGDHREEEHYRNEEELMDTIEMVPLVKDFDRSKDRGIVEALAEKYRGKNGISTTWHYYVLMARKVHRGFA